MDYCISAFQKEQETKALKIYVTDGIMAIANNLARAYGGTQMKTRFYDLAYTKIAKEETRTAEEIIENIRAKIEG